MHGHFRRAVEAGGDAAGTGAAGGVAVESVVGPGAGELGGRATSVADEGDAAGQADLSAVGVAGEHEVETVVERLVVDLGTVGEQDAAGALRDAAAGGLEVVGAVKVRIVEAGEMQILSVALNGGVFVEEHTESGGFEMRDDFDDVVVAEDREGTGSEGVGDPPDVAEAIVEVASRVVGKVSGDHGEIMRCLFDEGNEAVGETGNAIEVEVGKLKEAEAVEGGREIRKRLIAGDDFDSQAVGTAAGGETGEAEDAGDEVVDRDDAFDGERAFALVDEPGAEVGLAVETLAEERWTEARGQPAEIGRVV